MITIIKGTKDTIFKLKNEIKISKALFLYLHINSESDYIMRVVKRGYEDETFKLKT